MDEKRFFLERIFKDKQGTKILAFVRTKVRAERVVKAMKRADIEALCIHGDMEQADRQKALNAFRSGEVKLLIATDVSARGIDIAGVEIVINYDLPENPENYVHRVGRTGRGKNRGTALSFCSSGEKDLLVAIEDYIYKPIDRIELEKKDHQLTLDTAEGNQRFLKDMMDEIEQIKDFTRKKNKTKKIKK